VLVLVLVLVLEKAATGWKRPGMRDEMGSGIRDEGTGMRDQG